MLLEYLQEYTDRVKPLLDQNELFGKIQTEFEKKWENGTFPGWPVSSCEFSVKQLWIQCECFCVCDGFPMHCLCEIIAEVEFEENLHLKVAFLKLCLLLIFSVISLHGSVIECFCVWNELLFCMLDDCIAWRVKEYHTDVPCVFSWQKETSSALTHAGAHLDLSAFSSWEVRIQCCAPGCKFWADGSLTIWFLSIILLLELLFWALFSLGGTLVMLTI